jgi:uncharacterized CHY-type Zn-finger protein
METRRCHNCKKELPISKFTMNSNGKRFKICGKCQWRLEKIRYGRTTEKIDKIHSDIILKRCPVKVYTKKEIKEYERQLRRAS